MTDGENPQGRRLDGERTVPRSVRPFSASSRGGVAEDEFDLRDYLATFVEARWLIALVTAISLGLGVLYVLIISPTYTADALLQVEDKMSSMADLRDLSNMFNGDAPAEGEIEIIRSRSVISSVFDHQHLDVFAAPKYFPIVGSAIARRYKAVSVVAEPVLGLAQYAWGGERIRVENLSVSPRLEEEKFRLVAREGNRYDLYGPGGDRVLSGEIGQRAATFPAGVKPEPDAPYVELFVSELFARPGTQFTLVKFSRNGAILEFQDRLKAEERGKNTGIIGLTLEGKDPVRITAALNDLAQNYLRQNVERKSEEASKTLDFINAQLPELRASLEAAEVKLNEYRAKKGTVDLTLESRALIDKAVELKRQITELDLKKAELRQRFTDSHPALVALRTQTEELQRQQQLLEDKTKTLPEAQLNSVRLMRDVDMANELYLLLLNKAQELRVVKSGTIGNVRILDQAVVPDEPVKPKKPLVLLASLLAGLGLGLASAVARKALNPGVSDPEQLERELGLPVYATLPHSDKQETMARAYERNRRNGMRILAATDPTDLAVESLRSLRTSLQFALANARNNVILIGGSRPGVGKSFVSVNLAHVLGSAGKRVLLIDADMRKGQLHAYFGGTRSPGLSELLSGTATVESVVRSTHPDTPNLLFVATGVFPPNPSELLLQDRFRTVMERFSREYDLVIVDGPPILAVTDASILARYAGVTLLVLRAGLHPVRELALAVSRLNQNGVQPHGFVFNDLSLQARAYAYGRYGYQYQYEYGRPGSGDRGADRTS